MKKISVFFVLSILLASIIPMVLAEDNETQTTPQPELISEQDDNSSEVETTETPKLVREGLAQAREKYSEARQNYVGAKENYFDQKAVFLQKRDRLKECDDNSTECLKVREEVKENARDYLSKMSDMVLESLDKIKSRIEADEKLSDGDKESLIANIELRIKAIEDAKDNINASEAREDVLGNAKRIRDEWKDTKPVLTRAVDEIVSARMAGIIVQSEKLEEKLNRTIAKMESQGLNTSNASALVDDFSAKIDEAKANFEKARAKLDAAKNTTGNESHALLVEGHKLLKAAHTNLKEARVILKDIVKAIKGESNGKSVLKSEEDKIEKANETETENEDESELNESKVKKVKNETEIEDETEVEIESEDDSDSNDTEVPEVNDSEEPEVNETD